MATIHDLSVSLRPAGMEAREVDLKKTSHAEAARIFTRQHGLRVSQLPHGEFLSHERVELGSHDGTHLDAPYHFYPTSEGQPAKFMHEVPLSWCYGDALVLDFHRKPPEPITEYDVAGELERIGRTPKAGDIVMLWTGGTDGYDNDPKFNESAAGLNGGALNYLFRFGVRVMSTDSATIDIPIVLMREKLRAGDKSAYFPIHRAGRLTEWTHAEKLANMASLPAHNGFKALLFPINIHGGTGSWLRATAIEDEWLQSHEVEPIDLSLPIMNHSFERDASHVETVHHDMNRRRQAKMMGIKSEDVPHASAMDVVSTSTQSGTHVDAPAHFKPGGLTIDNVPLEWLYGDGVLLDFSAKRAGERISKADIQAALNRSGGNAQPGTIPLIRTGAAAAFADDPNFPDLGCALDVDAFAWLLDQGIRAVGCDSESLEGPLEPMVEAARSGHPEALYPIHYLGRERDFCLIEKMDLSRLTRSSGFKVSAFPVKLEGCGASWARAVALAPKG